MKTNSIATLHYLVVAVAISLPFWLDWKLVLLVVLIYHLIFTRGLGYCPLTVWQFGSADEGFIERHLKPVLKFLGLRPKDSSLKPFIRNGLPIVLVIFSFVWQTLVRK